MNDYTIKKFWDNIIQTNYCWNWVGKINKHGTPVLKIGTKPNDKEYSPRRISLELHNIKLFPNQPVGFICGNKLCVNPDHLVCGTEARFWAKVHKLNEPDGCWVWIGGHDKNGYGKFRIENRDKKDVRAHQYSWELYTGRVVPEGILLCHKCDHPWCVNPHHLFLGTNADNMHDRDSKNRVIHGETHHLSKLTNDQVKEIKTLLLTNIPQKQIAKLFGVSRSTISSINCNTTWTRNI